MRRFTAILLLFLPLAALAGDKLFIAAAANFAYVLDPLNAEFEKREPGTEVTVVTGSSGNLVAQIENGAPYDLFLSADMEFPAALIKAGYGEKASLTRFAVGRLVLWTIKPNVKLSSVDQAVRSPTVQKLAIANVKTAPYGRAAKEALVKLGVWAAAEPKIVMGDNITQTALFVQTGNADAGLVAMSLVLSPKLKSKGAWIEVPPELYAPLDHGAVITRRGQDNPAAKRYLAFLLSPEARRIFERFGYRIPN
ncbi:MAG: molybdate ABC transporter substrate-binding protein [Opitutaceae bacterium]|jgi:molybdate transport system substrate-binding protein